MNVVILSGNLTRAGELMGTPQGGILVKFGIAVNKRVKNSTTGQWEDQAHYFDCTMFGSEHNRRAQSLYDNGYFTKGRRVTVRGELRYSEWIDRDTGKKRSKVDIIVSDIEFERVQQTAPQQVAASIVDDEIPF